MMCGLMMQHEQLLKDAVGPNYLEKNYYDSRLYSEDEPLPWIPFRIESVPNKALSVLGACYFAS